MVCIAGYFIDILIVSSFHFWRNHLSICFGQISALFDTCLRYEQHAIETVTRNICRFLIWRLVLFDECVRACFSVSPFSLSSNVTLFIERVHNKTAFIDVILQCPLTLSNHLLLGLPLFLPGTIPIALLPIPPPWPSG